MSGSRERAYRSLLIAYPRRWREQHGRVVLDTLREVHAQTGRTAPSLPERLEFLARGMWTAVHRPRPGRLRRFADPAAMTDLRPFDQSNGLDRERVVAEREQIRANAGALRDTDQRRVAAVAFSGSLALAR